MEYYRLIKEIHLPVRGDKIGLIKPQDLIPHNGSYQTAKDTEGVIRKFSLSCIKQSPDFFERIIDWTKEKYFRLDEELADATKGKIYPIESINGRSVSWIDDLSNIRIFTAGTPMEQKRTPATEAEFLEQEKKNQPEGILWYHDFRDAKVGDKVYSLEYGAGTIGEVYDGKYWFIKVIHEAGFATYSEDGKTGCMAFPTLYKAKPTITPPEREAAK